MKWQFYLYFYNHSFTFDRHWISTFFTSFFDHRGFDSWTLNVRLIRLKHDPSIFSINNKVTVYRFFYSPFSFCSSKSRRIHRIAVKLLDFMTRQFHYRYATRLSMDDSKGLEQRENSFGSCLKSKRDKTWGKNSLKLKP